MLIRAHENKVFFEMLRHYAGSQPFRQIRSWWYGSYEEFRAAAGELPYPVLIKRPDGSMSRGVSLARKPQRGGEDCPQNYEHTRFADEDT